MPFYHTVACKWQLQTVRTFTLVNKWLILLVVTCCFNMPLAGQTNTVLTGLRCEYAVNPIGIDALQPRLSWITQATGRSWQQSAYRILVASSVKNLQTNKGDLWDSKKQLSTASNQVIYRGKPLTSHQLCFWKVMSWDTNNHVSGWSAPANWEMGVLKDIDWQAGWIGRNNVVYNEYDNTLTGSNWIWHPKFNNSINCIFTKAFSVSNKKIKDAYLLYTAENVTTAQLNQIGLKDDKEVNQKPVNPNEKWKQLKKVTISNWLKPGNNTLTFTARGGSKQAGLVCRLLITYIDNSKTLVISDSTWKANYQLTSSAAPDDAIAAKVIAPFGEKPWLPLIYNPPATQPAPYLRKAFTVTGAVKRARIYACAPGFAELRLNGKKVGANRERDPGFTRFDKRLLYATYDVTAQLKIGKNALGAILGTGWYDVHDLAVWNLEKAPWRGRPRLKLQLFVEYTDGRTQTICSGPGWKVADGPIRFDGIYTGEVYDANKEINGWDLSSYTDKTWKDAVTMPDPGGKMVALSCPPVGIAKTIKPIAITEPKTGVYVVDMGENFSGHTQLNISAPKGTVITMRYAEYLDDKGMIGRGNIESFMAPSAPPQLFQTDRYICKGKGVENWEQRFSYSGFRYVEVTGLPFKPTLDNFRGRFAYTMFEEDGKFECDNQLINNIQKIILQAYLSNSQNIPTDCPQREKNGWTADAHLAADLGIMNYNAASFYAKWLDDIADSQLPDGLIPVIVPSANWGEHWDPEWTSAYHIIAWDLYQYYGDIRILEKHYDRLKLYVDKLTLQRKNNLIKGYSYGDWAFYDTQTSKVLTANAYLYLDAEILTKIARLLNKPDDAATYARMANEVKNAFNSKFLNTATSLYDNGSQCALATPLYFDMVPPQDNEKVFNALLKKIDSAGHIDAGILGTKHLLRTLSDHNRTNLAYQLVNTTKNPGWGYFVDKGATSLWGGWGRKGTPNRGSLNHIMFGDVSAWFYRDLAGIQPHPEYPGFKHFVIKPGFAGDLKHVKAHYNSVYGLINVEWNKQGNSIVLNIHVPANTSATVYLPAQLAEGVKEGDKQLTEVKDITDAGQKDGYRVLKVGSGSYSFKMN
ncbi:glycoside hydrolase family 78 protein [Mucilaginibacter terrae]|uniref:glycoside hydrolase family 78 protein n=1 Tax=Mucilaginibacter terrae TaxID=1955052 RepID=UPI00363AD081